MLNVSNIKLYIQNYRNNTNKNANYSTNSFDIKNNNLKPLAKDTISFKGINEFKLALSSPQTCKNLNLHAVKTQKYLDSVLKDGFSDILCFETDENGNRKSKNPNGIVEAIESRIKSPDSIQEKIATDIEESLKQKDSKILHQNIFCPYDEEDIKKHISDICGTRIVLRDVENNNPAVVIDRLAKTIVDKGLIITKVKNYVPKDYPGYFNKSDMERLLVAINKVRKNNNLEPIEKIVPREKASGYSALHLGIDLTDVAQGEDGGYLAELQVIGTDVAKLKDVEDLCYKLKDGKQIKSGHPAYIPFERFFLEAYRNPNRTPKKQKMLEDAFDTYTQRAYAAQRKKSVKNYNEVTSNNEYQYPTLEECKVAGLLPEILDYNNLAKIKQKCDELYKIYSETNNNPNQNITL